MQQSNRDRTSREHNTVFQVQRQPTVQSGRQARRKYRDSLSIIGAFLFFFGMAAPIMSAYAMGQETRVVYYKRGPYFFLNQTLQGLWVGVFMVTSGILGLCALRNQSYSMYVANLVLSIVTIVFETAGLIIAFVGAALAWNRAIILQVLITLSIFFGLCLNIAQARLSHKGICWEKPSRQRPGQQTYLNTNIPIGNIEQVSANTVTPITVPHIMTLDELFARKDEDDDPPPPYPAYVPPPPYPGHHVDT